jgi:hypothetical protein
MTIATYDNNKSGQSQNLWQRLFSRDRVIVMKEESVGSVAWLKRISEAEYEAFCDYLDEEIEFLFKDNSTISRNGIKERMTWSLIELVDLYAAPNKKLISNSIIKINKAIEILQEYKKQEVDVPDKLYNRIYYKMDKLDDKLIAYSKKIDKKKISIVKGNSPLDKWQTPDVKIKALLKNDKYDVAAIEPFNNTGKRILAIVESFKTIELDLLSVEDKYMLQEIQSSYVPNIYTSALSLKHSELNVTEEAEKDFSTQLDFVENEIKRIKHDLNKRALDIIKSQTIFALERMNEAKAIVR